MGQAKQRRKWKEHQMNQRKHFWKRLGKAVLMFIAVVTLVPMACMVAWDTFQS